MDDDDAETLVFFIHNVGFELCVALHGWARQPFGKRSFLVDRIDDMSLFRLRIGWGL